VIHAAAAVRRFFVFSPKWYDELVELTLYTDYSLRVLLYLGLREDRVCQLADIAEAYGVSRHHLLKVVQGLARHGFVRTFRGKGGGITLARAPRDINIGRVIRLAEGPIQPVECLRGDANHCVITGACRLTRLFQEAAQNFLSTFDHVTLADLLAHRKSQISDLLIH